MPNLVPHAGVQLNASAATWGDSYVYDAWGNLLQKNVIKGTAESMALTVNAQNQVTTPAFTYDAAGNVTWDTTNALKYDAEGRMTPTSGTTYTYDGDGRRVQKSDGTLYWVDDSLRPLSVGTTSGSITRDYIFLGGKRIAFVPLSSGNPYYYLSDHLGSTAVIASGDGKAVQWEADYFPFGSQRTVITNLADNPYQFTGYEYDSGTGYNYAVARFDAGRWGRFMSPDPYLNSMSPGHPQSLNRYSYVLNNPLRAVDPLGLDCAYLNDAGDSIEEVDIDADTSMSECAETGGNYVPGTLNGYGTGDDGTINSLNYTPYPVNSGVSGPGGSDSNNMTPDVPLNSNAVKIFTEVYRRAAPIGNPCFYGAWAIGATAAGTVGAATANYQTIQAAAAENYPTLFTKVVNWLFGKAANPGPVGLVGAGVRQIGSQVNSVCSQSQQR